METSERHEWAKQRFADVEKHPKAWAYTREAFVAIVGMMLDGMDLDARKLYYDVWPSSVYGSGPSHSEFSLMADDEFIQRAIECARKQMNGTSDQPQPVYV